MAKPVTHLEGAQTAPSSFAITTEFINDRRMHRQIVRWTGSIDLHQNGTVTQVECTTGYPQREESPQRHETLRQEIWALMEAGRLGRGDLLAYARTDRHRSRPAPKPVPPEMAQAIKPKD